MLGDLIKEVAEEYKNAPVGRGLKQLDPNLKQRIVKEIPHEMLEIFNNNKISSGWKTKGSCGQGRVAAIPWCRIADPRISPTSKKGIYIVYLFSHQIKKVYLALAFGVEEKQDEYNQQNKDWKEEIKNDIKIVISRISKEHITGFETVNSNVNLGDVVMAENYEAGTILYKEYSLDNFPENEIIEEDFIKMMEAYKSYIDNMKEQSSIDNQKETRKTIEEETQEPLFNETEAFKETQTKVEEEKYDHLSIDKVDAYIRGKGFSFSKDVLQNYYVSLRTKPFVILAGISGTGKSQIVKLFADAINAEYKLIPVRPDWTDSSDIFGHLNLQGNQFINDSVIKFILEANRNLNKPYFLCLDEMNLARVEYYFADFLSIIETRHWDNKHQHIVSDPLVQDIFEQYKDVHPEEDATSIYISDNLYVIGTVNMDESTFPFSKKVLDRANTIEFNEVDISIAPDFWEQNNENKTPINVSNSDLRSKYLLPIDISSDEHEQAEKICTELKTINDILSKANLNIGYRVRNEILFYCLYTPRDNNTDFKSALDKAIMQKLLPRIQGSGKQLKDMIRNLLCHFCGVIRSNDEIIGMSDQDFDGMINANEIQNYAISCKKLKEMLRRLKDDGYTAFWI